MKIQNNFKLVAIASLIFALIGCSSDQDLKNDVEFNVTSRVFNPCVELSSASQTVLSRIPFDSEKGTYKVTYLGKEYDCDAQPNPTPTPTPSPEYLIADHNAVMEFDNIPEEYLTQAKNLVTIYYGHTSHGSQITSGMMALKDFNSLYSFHNYSTIIPSSLSYVETAPDAGYYPAWKDETLSMLNNSSNNRNTVMWAWCRQLSYYSSDLLAESYLDPMSQLENGYSETNFIYMTGPLDTTGSTGNLHQRNEQIRDHVIANGGILFDFADIERFDPDGNDYLDLGAGAVEGDGCRYDGGNWCVDWCNNNPDSELCLPVEFCAHSFDLNCNMKARAFWWMMARLAGWDGSVGGEADVVPPMRSNGAPTGILPADTTQASLSLNTNESASCKYSQNNTDTWETMPNTFENTGGYYHSSLIPVNNGNSYTFYVRCSDTSGNVNTDSYMISFSVQEGDLAAPTNVLAVAGSGQIFLTWQPVEDAQYYLVYWGNESQVYTNIDYIEQNSEPSYLLDDVENDVTYYFAISAKSATGQSELSEEVFATPQTNVAPIPPQNLNVLGSTENSISIGWEAVNGVSFYVVYYGTQSGIYDHIEFIDASENSFSIEGLASGNTYFIAVTGMNPYGESDFSNEINRTTSPAVTPIAADSISFR